MFNKINQLILLLVSYKSGLKKPLNPPYKFNIESTNHCNFKCAYCPQSDSSHKYAREFGFLTPENFRLILNKRKQINPALSHISITLDGEPLINKNFPEFIKIAAEERVHPQFSSNGKLLTPELVQSLLKQGPFTASIDFSSEEKIFDTLRGTQGDFQIVYENIKFLIDMAIANPKIKIEITDMSSFNGINPQYSLKNMISLFPPQLPKNVKFYSRKFHNFVGHLNPKSNNKSYKLCPYPWTHMVIAWNGDVVSCCRDTQGKTILGNIYKQSISEIWLGEKYQNLRYQLASKHPENIENCAKCDLPWSSNNDRWTLSYIKSFLTR